jgi:hypothetical protein
VRAAKKGEKERKDKEKKKKSGKMTAKTMFHKIIGNLGKMQALGDIILHIFSPKPKYFLLSRQKE